LWQNIKQRDTLSIAVVSDDVLPIKAITGYTDTVNVVCMTVCGSILEVLKKDCLRSAVSCYLSCNSSTYPNVRNHLYDKCSHVIADLSREQLFRAAALKVYDFFPRLVQKKLNSDRKSIAKLLPQVTTFFSICNSDACLFTVLRWAIGIKSHKATTFASQI